MLTPIPRTEIFQTNQFVDNFIAEMQDSYAQYIDQSVPREGKMLAEYYDHLQAFNPSEEPIMGHCVLAYDAESKKDYVENLPLVLQGFYEALGITQLYLMDFNKTSLLDFPYENFKKQNEFKRLAKGNAKGMGYMLEVADLPKMMPLFFFSKRHDKPVIFFLTATGDVPLSIRMCDDGNLHLNYQEKFDEQIEAAAEAAGLDIGDIEICTVHRVHELK
ncbi:hypothetical protein BH09BAC1_BH09BAC1_15160 [soil metagenome]